MKPLLCLILGHLLGPDSFDGRGSWRCNRCLTQGMWIPIGEPEWTHPQDGRLPWLLLFWGTVMAAALIAVMGCGPERARVIVMPGDGGGGLVVEVAAARDVVPDRPVDVKEYSDDARAGEVTGAGPGPSDMAVVLPPAPVDVPVFAYEWPGPCDPVAAVGCGTGERCAVGCTDAGPATWCTMGDAGVPGRACRFYGSGDCPYGWRCVVLGCASVRGPGVCVREGMDAGSDR